MPDLAKAYVQIIPSAQGMQGQLEGLLGGEAESAGESAGKRFSGKFGTMLKVGGAAAAAGVAAIAKSAVTAYADYEQLVGGVETLFSSLDGTVSAAPQVLAAAENAYKTAGLSANEYMETVTSFSAALVSSLDGDYAKAAQISDMAITDMSDNANKMGSNMESIQMAYQGFAKQNYTMLDNLKLGYGGTKTEMERLLADATAFSGVEYNIDNLNDVYEAIHVIQTEMGIAGTTAEEASSTISGSLGMTKASWENLMAGMANGNADLGALMGQLVDSAGTLASNIVPVIGEALGSIGEVAPQLVTTLVGTIVENLPAVIEGGVQLLVGIVTGLIQGLPQLIAYVPTIISSLFTALVSGVGQILSAGVQLMDSLISGIGSMLGNVFSKGIEVVTNVWNAITSWFGQLFQAGADLASNVVNGIGSWIGNIYAKGVEIVQNVWNGIKSWFGQIFDSGAELVSRVGSGITSVISTMQSMGGNIVNNVKQGFMNMVSDALSWGSHLVQNIAQGIRNAISFVSSAASSVAGAISSVLRHSVPEEGPLADDDVWGVHLVQNIARGMESQKSSLRRQAESVAGIVRDSMQFDSEFTASAGGSGRGIGGSSYINNTFNIYGAEGQSEDALADAIARKLYQTTQKKAVFA